MKYTHLLLIVLAISIVLSLKRYIYDIKHESPNVLGYIIGFLHYFIIYFALLLGVKCFIFKIKLLDYLLLVFIIITVLLLGFTFKQCMLTIVENKLLKLGKNFTWGSNIMSSNDRNAIKMGYVYPEFIKGQMPLMIFLLILTFKLYYEKYILKLKLS